jgi:hypothetical protein
MTASFWLMHADDGGVSAGLLVLVAYWGQHRLLPRSGEGQQETG